MPDAIVLNERSGTLFCKLKLTSIMPNDKDGVCSKGAM